MTRIPPPERDDMDADQQAVYDRIVGDNGRVGFGPAIGYSYSGPVWNLHNVSSKHLLDCSLSAPQIRIISLMTVKHWNAAYPWSAQAKTALNAGLDPAIIEAINEGKQPDFQNDDDAAVFAVTRELLASGNLSDTGFKAAEETLGHRRMVEVVHTIGHFCTTGMMANMVGCVPPEDAVSRLKS